MTDSISICALHSCLHSRVHSQDWLSSTMLTMLTFDMLAMTSSLIRSGRQCALSAGYHVTLITISQMRVGICEIE